MHMNKRRSIFLRVWLVMLLSASYGVAHAMLIDGATHATLIDFESPPLGAEPRRILNPYQLINSAGVTFTVASPVGTTEVVGLVKNNTTSVCVEPSDSDQKLGSGRSNFAGGAIGYGTSAIRATFAQPLQPPLVVAVDFQTGAGIPVRMRLLDLAGNEVAAVVDVANPANGTCGLPGQMRARKRLTVRAEQAVASVVMDLGPDTGRFVFTLDNFEFGAAPVIEPPPTGAQSDLALVGMIAPETIRAGEPFTYTLNLTNRGPATAEQIVLTGTLASGITLLAAAAEQATCHTADVRIICAVRALPVNASTQMQWSLIPAAERTGKSITFSALVENQQGPDPDPTNNMAAAVVAVTGARVVNGLQALYPFAENQQLAMPALIHDVAGIGPPLTLRVQAPTHVQSTLNGLQILTPTLITSEGAAHKLTQAAQATGELSVEAWIVPDERTQTLVAPLLSLGKGSAAASFSLTQEQYGNQVAGLYTAQLVTNQVPTGNRLSAAPIANPARQLTHLVFTRNAAGLARIYLNGVARATKAMSGDFATWDPQALLRLATDDTGLQFWLGEYQLVAFYSRALDATEVQQNYAAGPQGEGRTEDATTSDDDLFGFDYEVWLDPATPLAQVPVKLGTVVQRQGGKAVLTDVGVRFYLGDPTQNGQVIGNAVIERLSPRGSAISSDVTWTPPAAGVYTIYIQIDPDNRIREANETNNLLMRTVTVRAGDVAPNQDLTAPHVDLFSIDDNSGTTPREDVTLAISVSDPLPSAGVESVAFVEYEYVPSAGAWQIAQLSAWLPYNKSLATYAWRLRATPGLKYLQAWAKDKAGNISHFPYTRYVNYAPPIQTIDLEYVHFLRYPLQAGERITVRLEARRGDPDLYVWPPDHGTGRPPWVSNLRSGVDSISFVAPVAGVYQIEIYGYTAAEYQLQVTTDSSRVGLSNVIAGAGTLVSDAEDEAAMNGIDPTKPRHSQPSLSLESTPSINQALLIFAGQGYKIFLPMIR